MITTVHTPEEVARIGDQIYRDQIRASVLPQHKGKFLIMDIRTGQYEIDEDDVAATERLQARLPDAEIYGLRIGYTAAYTLAGRMTEDPG